jgi:hypothetical protein
VKAEPTLSPDRAMVAYSVAASLEPGSINLSPWRVRLMTLADGTDVDLGPGFNPQFFVRDGKIWLVYTSQGGVTVFDIAERKGYTTPFTFVDRLDFSAEVSPDGLYIALRDAATGDFSLYAIDNLSSDRPLSLTPTAVDLTDARDVHLETQFAYALVLQEGQGEVRKIPYDGSPVRRLYIFSATSPYRFIP